MIWLAAQLWPAALIALVAGFAVTWFAVVQRLDEAPADEGRSVATTDTSAVSAATQADGAASRGGGALDDQDAVHSAGEAGSVGHAFTSRREE